MEDFEPTKCKLCKDGMCTAIELTDASDQVKKCTGYREILETCPIWI